MGASVLGQHAHAVIEDLGYGADEVDALHAGRGDLTCGGSGYYGVCFVLWVDTHCHRPS